jgi:hypothetical protein
VSDTSFLPEAPAGTIVVCADPLNPGTGLALGVGLDRQGRPEYAVYSVCPPDKGWWKFAVYRLCNYGQAMERFMAQVAIEWSNDASAVM